MKGLVGYNISLDDKSLIPKSLARHLKVKARVMVHCISWFHSGTVLTCKFPAGCLSLICYEELGWLKIFNLEFKIDGRAYAAFMACLATCGAVNIFTPQLHTLQTMKSWSGPGMRLGYEQVELSGLAVLEQLPVQSNSEHR